jgi:hypothetical protein
VPDAQERPALAAPGAARVAKPYVIDELRRAVEEG